MFELSSFIVKNTVNGVKNGTFSKEYANIMAVNYMLKGVLAEEDVISVNTQIEAWEAEQEAQKAENSEDLTEGRENIEEEETSPEMDELEATEGDSLTESTEEDPEELIDAEDEGEPLV